MPLPRVVALALALLCGTAGAQEWTFVQLSDPHVGSAVGLPHLRLLLERVEEMRPPPRLVVVTGDLTEKGLPREVDAYSEEVEAFEERSGIPVLSAPGNHDVRWNALGRALVAERLGATPNVAVIDDVGFVALDSTLSFGQHGQLSDRELEELDRVIAATPQVRDWVLAMHHPPGEGAFLAGEHELLRRLNEHPITAVLTGHGHRHRRWQTNGVLHVMAIGTMNREFGYRWFEVGEHSIVPHTLTIRGSEVESERGPPVLRRRGGGSRPAEGAVVEIVDEGSGPAVAVDSASDLGLSGKYVAAGAHATHEPARLTVSLFDMDWLPPGFHDLVASVDGFEVPVTVQLHGDSDVALADLHRTLLTAPLALDDLLVVACEEGEVLALDPASLDARWRTTLEPRIWVSPWRTESGAIAVADGTPSVRLLDHEGNDGARRNLPAPVTATAPRQAGGRWLALADGRVVSWTEDGGAKELAVLPAATRAAPLEIDGGLLVAPWDRHVHRIDGDGAITASTLVHRSFYYSAATADPVRLGSTAMFFGHDHRLLRFAADGTLAGEHVIEGVRPSYSGGTLAKVGLVLGSLDGAVAVVDPDTLALRRRIPTDGAVFDSTPLVVGRRAWVGTMDGELVEADLAAGEVTRRVRLGGYVVADPVRAGDRAVAVSTTGRIASVPLRR